MDWRLWRLPLSFRFFPALMASLMPVHVGPLCEHPLNVSLLFRSWRPPTLSSRIGAGMAILDVKTRA